MISLLTSSLRNFSSSSVGEADHLDGRWLLNIALGSSAHPANDDRFSTPPLPSVLGVGPCRWSVFSFSLLHASVFSCLSSVAGKSLLLFALSCVLRKSQLKGGVSGKIKSSSENFLGRLKSTKAPIFIGFVRSTDFFSELQWKFQLDNVAQCTRDYVKCKEEKLWC